MTTTQQISAAYFESKVNREGKKYWEVSVYFNDGRPEQYFSALKLDVAMNAAQAAIPELITEDVEFEQV